MGYPPNILKIYYQGQKHNKLSLGSFVPWAALWGPVVRQIVTGMNTSLAISLLGRFQLTRSGAPVSGIESDRGRALLAYLVVEGDRPHRRDGLGALLWPDADDARMRQNLRRALYNLRQTLDPPVGHQPLLLITPQDVQLNPQSDHWLDVAQFRTFLAQWHHPPHTALEVCAACYSSLAGAVALYRGDFLAGFSLPANERFEEWRLFTQEALHVQMLDALTGLATYHMARQEHTQAITYLQRQIELEPWREEAHRTLMRLFAARGERSAALAQYALCTRLLAEELGAPPATETDQLYEQILRGEIGKSPETPPIQVVVPPNLAKATAVLPALATPFLGRQSELALIAQQLGDPACRLLTLAGLGGVGKTQLALSAAHALTITSEAGASTGHRFRDGLYFVALADLAAPQPQMGNETDHYTVETHIGAAIANVLGFDLQADIPLVAQLGAYLHDKACLLILDNYEHLLDGADLVNQLLAAAPLLKIMVTSRLPLHQPDEWLLPVEGFLVPGSIEADLERYESVALFVQWARRKQSYFSLDAENQGAIVEICQLVEGLPLGIVLAASCYPELTCAEISTEIRRNLVILAAEAATQPPDLAYALTRRHRNLQAVFEASWQILTPAEQCALGRAAVFQGGFTRQAGLQITGATLGELSGLVARVLLRRTSSGRYVMHELLRQFVSAKLAESAEIQDNAPQQRHSHYYLDWALQQASALAGTDLPQAMTALRTELANLRVAWRWAAQQQQHDRLLTSVDVLAEFYEVSGLLGEAELLFGEALSMLHGVPASAEQVACEAKLTIALLRMLYGQGKLTAAEAWIERSRSLAHATNDPLIEFQSIRSLLQIRMAQGAYDEAETVAAQALIAAQQAEDKHLLTLALLDQSKLALARHRYAEAQAAIEQTLRLSDKAFNPLLQDTIFRFLGLAAYYQGEMAQAKTYDEQGLQLARTLGSRLRVADHLLHLGAVQDALGDYGAAQVAYQEALAIYRERGSRQHEISVLGNLGISTAYLGDYAEAIRYTRQALDLQTELGKVNQRAIAFTNLALFYHQLGDQASASDYAQQGILTAQQEGDRYIEGFAHTFLGHAHSALGAFAAAEQEYQQALACYRALNLTYLTPEPQAGLARLWLAQNNLAVARATIEPILALIAGQPLEGLEEPMRVYHTCYQVLAATGDAQAGAFLTSAYVQLQRRAERIQDSRMRAAFLNRVAAHLALTLDYEKLTVTP